MKKKILILSNDVQLFNIDNIVNFDDLKYMICGYSQDIDGYKELLEEYKPEIVLCDEYFYNNLKITHPKQYKLVLTDNIITVNNYTYVIRKPLTAEKIISRLYTIDFHMLKQKDKLEHRINVTEFLLPLLLDYKGEYSDTYINDRVHSSYLLHDYEDPCFSILSFELSVNSKIIDIDYTYLEEIDSIVNNYINAYSYIIGNRIISFCVLSHAGRITNINKAIEELKTKFSNNNLDIIIGISAIFNHLSHTHTSFLEAIHASKANNQSVKKIKLIMPINEFLKDIEKNIIYIIKNESEEELVNIIEYCFLIKNEEEKQKIFNIIFETVYKTTLNITGVNQFIQLITKELFTQNTELIVDEEYRKKEFIRLMLNARTCINQNKKDDTESLCDQVMDIIRQEYQDENLSLVNISKRLGVSTNYLCALIKKVLGKNYTTLISEVRMEAAKVLLETTNLKINEVSIRCGYSDQHYFSTCFKKYFGVSPNKVKNRQNKQ